ncbi:MAG: ABC transporter ATP-binding protein [Ktedonobacterales bacterium]
MAGITPSTSTASTTASATQQPIIVARSLTKSYGASRGITKVSFEIAEGEVFGFLGPNGAGKTTTIRVFMGMLRPTSGAASIGGLDCWSQSTEVKRLVGYLPGEFSFDPRLTGAQILEYLGNLRGGVDRAYRDQLIARLELDPSKRFRDYSRGNKQKVGLAQAFMGRPRLLILDEPTSGLDPLNQQEFYKLVREVRNEGRTVFLSSHILPEVEHTCDRVGIIREGELVKVDQVANLKDLRQHAFDIRFASEASPAWFASLPGVISAEPDGPEGVHVIASGPLAPILKVAADHNAVNIVTHEPSLEDIFLRFYTPDASRSAANEQASTPAVVTR